MTEDNGPIRTSPYDALRRYVPLAVWALVILVILAIPLKITGYGYLPGDDALRHAAKAVSGKPWPEILVLGPAFRDQNFVWHLFLRQIHLWTHCGTDGLVVLSVVGLFIVWGCSPLPWLKRPESWLITLTTIALASGAMPRLMLGRPFLLTIVIALCPLVHGVLYLWVLPVAAFFLARQFAWGRMVAIGWVAGTLLGAV